MISFQPRRVLRPAAILVLLVAVVPAAISAAEQPTRLRAWHRQGQTFLTWQEAAPPTGEDPPPVMELRQLARELRDTKNVRYRIYRSTQPIRSVTGLSPIADVPPLSCWNLDYYGAETWNKDHKAFRYVVEEGQPPLPPGTGLAVCNPPQAGEAYYAVTISVGGQENTTLGEENRSAAPLKESVGPGVPVLQRIERPREFNYVARPTLHYFVRWESPPNCAVQGKPFDYLVAVPEKPARPAPVGIHLHCWGGNLNGGYGWWYNAEKGHILLASNQVPYDWWTGYHERYWTGRREKAGWQDSVVRPYSQRRMLSFLDWVATRWDVDLKRTHVAGSSMGGSGSPMLAIRYPDRIAWAVSWVGVHTPARSPQFKGSYANVFGEPEWGVRFADGTAGGPEATGPTAWEYFDDAWYLRRHPDKEIGFITFSNGKNDGGIGWPQAAEFFRALQETKRPHLFVWGQAGHGQRARMPVTLEERVLPIDLRVDQSLPAFTRCSLDDRPGSGDPKDGDPAGQANLYLFWQTENIVDQPETWEMTVGLIGRSPKDECTVDVTPRRLQQFRAAPGQTVHWSNASGGKVIQSGQVTADRLGLVTLEQVRVNKGQNRLALSQGKP